MNLPIVRGIVVTMGVAGLATLGLSLYTAQKAPAEAKAIRDFLSAALVADTAELRSRAIGEQPVVWALSAVDRDSAAVARWTRRGTLVRTSQSHDTLIVSLWHPGSVRECSYLSTLTGAFVLHDGVRQLTRLSATCPVTQNP